MAKKKKFISIQDRIIKLLTIGKHTLESIYRSFNGNLDKPAVEYALEILKERSLICEKLRSDGILIYSI